MFRLQVLPNGNVHVFHISNGELAMVITSNIENSSSGPVRKVPRSLLRQPLLEAHKNGASQDEWNPYVVLPSVTFSNGKGFLEAYCKNDSFSSSHINEKEINKIPDTKESFLQLFQLQPRGDGPAKVSSARYKVIQIPSEDGNPHEPPPAAISSSEVSSRLGQLLTGHTRSESFLTKRMLLPYEIHCARKRNLRIGGHFPVTYNSHRGDVPICERKFCFNFDQRLERRRSLRYGLSTRSRLLLGRCRRCSTRLTKLPSSELFEMQVAPPTPATPAVVGGSRVDAVIDGTVVIQLDNSDEESFTSMPKAVFLPSLPSAATFKNCRDILQSSSTFVGVKKSDGKPSNPKVNGHYHPPAKFVIKWEEEDTKPMISTSAGPWGPLRRPDLGNRVDHPPSASSSNHARGSNGAVAVATANCHTSFCSPEAMNWLMDSLADFFAPLMKCGVRVRLAPLSCGSLLAGSRLEVCDQDCRCVLLCLKCDVSEVYRKEAVNGIHEHIRNCFASLDDVTLVAKLDQFFQFGVMQVQAS